MMSNRRLTIACLMIVAAGSFTACGSGSSSSSRAAANTVPIAVNGGPNNNYANGVFATVSVCVAGTSTCQMIPDVLVDTGSFGLRILSSAMGTMGVSLAQQKGSNGNPIFECAQFVNSVLWGPVKTADVQMGSQKAPGIPVQIIDSTTVPVPSGCKSIGPPEEDLTSLGANGILGIGFFISDCGNACAMSGSSNPGFYYSCAASSCSVTTQATSAQVQNPVAAFAQDNNGVLIELPASASTAPSLNGSLIFGIGTQNNNSIGAAQVFKPDNFGNLVTTFKTKQYAGFLDTGSNGYFFLDSTLTGLTDCPSPETGFYCPPSPANLSATNASAPGGTNNTVNFTIGNASQMLSSSGDFVFPTLGGPNPGSFDWGLPFFFGRKVFVAIEGRSTPSGAGPFWAY